MAKKERLGTDPFKGGSLDWIQDTRKEKKPEEKNHTSDSKASKSLNSKTAKRQSVKELENYDANKLPKKKHTVYLTPTQSKKLRVYAAANDIQMSEVVEKLINDNL